MEEGDVTAQSGYDQKAFLQIRLHELLSRVGKFQTNPLMYNLSYGVYNYEVISNDLCSVFETIYSKLTPKEKDFGKEMREKLLEAIELRIFSQVRDSGQRKLMKYNKEGWGRIREAIFSFRCLLEEFMDKHGFNPSKEDARRAITKM